MICWKKQVSAKKNCLSLPFGTTPPNCSPSTGLYKFDSGGLLQPGLTTVLNATGKPEPVFTGGQWDKIDDLLSKGNSGVPEVLEPLAGQA